MDLISSIETRMKRLEKKIRKKHYGQDDENLRKAMQELTDESKLVIDLVRTHKKSETVKVILKN